MEPTDILNAGQKVGAVTMTFIVIDIDYVENNGGKEAMNRLATQWQGMMVNAGNSDVKFYAVDPDRMLVVTNSAQDQKTLIDFVFGFDHTDYVEVRLIMSTGIFERSGYRI